MHLLLLLGLVVVIYPLLFHLFKEQELKQQLYLYQVSLLHQELLQQQLGLNLPVSHLLWWIRGLPAPDSRSRLALDGDSRLARLAQDGWDVEYLRYVEQDGYWLPERLRLTGHDLQVTLVIKDWQPRQLGH